MMKRQENNEKFRQLFKEEFRQIKSLGTGGMGEVFLVQGISSGKLYAVKTAKNFDEKSQARLLAELKTWIELPRHPNITTCFFFRLVDGEVIIFSEFVSGGSLKDFINSRALYRGESAKVLENILDIAIQSAWSLQCLHDLGFIHMDVKPANFLLEFERENQTLIKVADFGLSTISGENSKGSSMPYCSPEQASGEVLTHKTDIWSWGLTILELFKGEITWYSGVMANEILTDFIEQSGKDSDIPSPIVEILRGCFRKNPAERWNDFAEIIEILKSIFESVAQKKYPEKLIAVGKNKFLKSEMNARCTAGGGMWKSPVEWLEFIAKIKNEASNGKPFSEAESFANTNRQGHLVSDLMLFKKAQLELEQMIMSGNDNLKDSLARLYLDESLVCLAANDFHAAIVLLDKSIELLNSLQISNSEIKLLMLLVDAYSYKGNAISQSISPQFFNQNFDFSSDISAFNQEIRKKLESAIQHYEFALELLNKAGGSSEINTIRVTILINQAMALQKSMDHSNSIKPLAKALEIIEQTKIDNANEKVIDHLAISANNLKARSLSFTGNEADAEIVLTENIQRIIHLIGEPGFFGEKNKFINFSSSSGGYEDILAQNFIDKGGVLVNMGRENEAIACFNEAIGLLKYQIEIAGRGEFREHLGTALINNANAHFVIGDVSSGRDLFISGMRIYEHLVLNEGQNQLSGLLASIKNRYENVIQKIGNVDSSKRDNKKISLLISDDEILEEKLIPFNENSNESQKFRVVLKKKEVIDSQSRSDLYAQNYEFSSKIKDARMFMELADSNKKNHDFFGAVENYKKSVEILETLFEQSANDSFAESLLNAYSNLALTLSLQEKSNESLQICDRGIKLFRKIVKKEPSMPNQEFLALLLITKGIVATKCDLPLSLNLFNEAEKTILNLIASTPKELLYDDLVKIHKNKGLSLGLLEKHEEAIVEYRKAVSIIETRLNFESALDAYAELNFILSLSILQSSNHCRGKDEAEKTLRILNHGSLKGSHPFNKYIHTLEHELKVYKEKSRLRFWNKLAFAMMLLLVCHSIYRWYFGI